MSCSVACYRSQWCWVWKAHLKFSIIGMICLRDCQRLRSNEFWACALIFALLTWMHSVDSSYLDCKPLLIKRAEQVRAVSRVIVCCHSQEDQNMWFLHRLNLPFWVCFVFSFDFFYFLSLIFFFLRLASFCEPHLVFGQIVLSSSIECLFKLATLTSRPAQKRAHLLSCLPFHPLRILR